MTDTEKREVDARIEMYRSFQQLALAVVGLVKLSEEAIRRHEEKNR